MHLVLIYFEPDIEQAAAALESTTTDLITSASAGLGGQEHTWDELVTAEEDDQPDDLESIADKKGKADCLHGAFQGLFGQPGLVDDIF